MNNLADFKRALKAAVNNPLIRIRATVFDRQGKLIRTIEACSVDYVSGSWFSVSREQKENRMNFYKAGDWSFTPTTATYRDARGQRITFELGKQSLR